MGFEIERKFLVRNDGWRHAVQHRVVLRDGLLSHGERGKVRIRRQDDKAVLALKGPRLGFRRVEYEYAIPLDEADEILAGLCSGAIVEKIRHFVPHCGHVWEVDEFVGTLSNVVWAEIELESEDEPFERPAWLGEEVTGDPRFRHSTLLRLVERIDGQVAMEDVFAATL
ncbi:CYTH domain-containing protein [Fulvimarina manganoxydans]|uniref:CYTH domain-containing protein n=1 Tax=Fulvimarina manganoxydans TaxID=937218 RepID=A0A1W2DAE3_9HYPH|nr:CYTH domain-containing protein [Fulvimarina manganoxydans]SMC94016.1 CYTH domain-containing protein [Fulvimarina manganoxydans]